MEARMATAKVRMPAMLPVYDRGLSSPSGQMQSGQLAGEDIFAIITNAGTISRTERGRQYV